MIPIKFQNIIKAYEPAKPVLRKICLEIGLGELFFLLGPSGCGKTTLLRLVAGFLLPDAGTIHFGARDVTRVPAEQRQTGMVFQNYALWPHLTVYENVAFGLKIKGTKPAEEKTMVEEVLNQVGLLALAQRKPGSLSGGQQQRVALARAMVIKPQVLLLDEPLSNLDAKLRLEMRAEIRRICKDAGLTSIYVTHDRKEALSMADRIAVLQEGAIQQVGRPEELYRRPINRFVADFMGESAFLPVTVTELRGGKCRLESPLGPLLSSNWRPGLTAGMDALMAIRPESIVFAETAGPGPVNCFAGILQDGKFLGELGLWKVRCREVTLTVAELNPPPREFGRQYIFTVKPEQVIVLPK